MKRSYRDLFIWQSAVDLAVRVIELSDEFPQRQRRVLVEQMQRCAVSVPSNIAEGKGRLSQKELRHFLAIARGSLSELDTQLEIARRVGLIKDDIHIQLEHRIAITSTGINRLLARLGPSPKAVPP
jgi:four helix bundle protein